MKRVSKIEWIIDRNIKDVWNIVTNLEDYKWRNDLSKLEIINDKEFTEYFTNGGQTNFFITNKEFCNYYSFDMKNDFFVGQWTGEFIEINTQQTKLIFSEEINIKNPFIWFFSFFVMNLKKIQKEYMIDLERKLTHE